MQNPSTRFVCSEIPQLVKFKSIPVEVVVINIQHKIAIGFAI